MALQTSGPISFANLQTEFDGTHPITMGEYAEYRASGSGNTISMDQFYGTSAGGFLLTQAIWSSNNKRGYDLGEAKGSVIPYPAQYEGVTIDVLTMTLQFGMFFIDLRMNAKNLGIDFFTTFTGGGFTLQTPDAGYNELASANGVSWTWVTPDAGGWTGSGDLDITIT